jgi:argininosuccinate synthase
LTYYGLWETPLRQQLDAFINKTQERVSGKVRLKLYKGSCQVTGRISPYSRYKKELATYGDKDIFDPKLSEGFIRIWGMPY